jgi:hypothetical protein
VQRIKNDFATFIADDQVQVFDIMQLVDLTGYELSQKLIFVVKKEDDNKKRLLDAFGKKFPVLRSKKLLIVDDEADFASVSFRSAGGVTGPGVIASQIDQLQHLVERSHFLQVTSLTAAQNENVLFLRLASVTCVSRKLCNIAKCRHYLL